MIGECADGCVFSGFILGEHFAQPFDCRSGFSLETGFDDFKGVKFAIAADKRFNVGGCYGLIVCGESGEFVDLGV
jgi:hypothetical protein